MAACYHLLHNTITIEKGDDITVVTLFIAKPLKKATIVAIAFFYNKAIKERDGSYCRLLFLFCKIITEEGNDICCRHVLLLRNTTIEKDDGALSSSFFFFQTQRKRWRQLVAITFFIAIEPQKKMMTMCRYLFLFKHREKGDDSKLLSPSSLQQHHVRKQPKKWREGRELTFKLPLCLLIFGSYFKRVVLVAIFSFPLLAPSFALPFLPSRCKLSWALMMEWAQNEVK